MLKKVVRKNKQKYSKYFKEIKLEKKERLKALDRMTKLDQELGLYN